MTCDTGVNGLTKLLDPKACRPKSKMTKQMESFMSDCYERYCMTG